MSTGAAEFLDPLNHISVTGTGLLPGQVTVGSNDVAAITAVLQHSGGAGESAARCLGLTVRILDQSGQGVTPFGLLDAVRVESGGIALATVFITAAHTSDLSLPFTTPVLTGYGERDTLTVLLDFDSASESAYLQLHIGPQGLEIEDATDGTPVVSLEGEFPLVSGLTQIILPADEVLFHADGLLPANVTGGSVVEVFALSFERESGSGSATALLDSITFDLLDRMNQPVDPARLVADLKIMDGGAEVSVTSDVVGNRLVVGFDEPVAIEAGGSVDLVMVIELVQEAGIEIFSMQITDAGDITCTDAMSEAGVAVSPSPGHSFPFNSGRAAFLRRDIRAAFTNYPNPFIASSEVTKITYYLPDEGLVTIKVYTITGRLVRTLLVNTTRSAGLHEDCSWDGRNGKGETVLNGVYYLMLTMKVNGMEHSFKRKVAVVR